MCDVWVAEKSSILGYQTTEIFFSRHDWNILVEEVNAHQELPVGMATYTAANVSGHHVYRFKGLQYRATGQDVAQEMEGN